MSLTVAVLTALIAAPVHAASLDRWQPDVAEAAQRFAVPEAWIRAVIDAESGGDPSSVSPKGARGLMQIMPETWAELRVRYGVGADPFDPRDNILAGTAYLREMADRFGYPGLFAAYNAGPARYQDHLRSRNPLPAETENYLAVLTRSTSQTTKTPVVASGTRLFFSLRTVAGPSSENASDVAPGGLFVRLTTVSAPLPPVSPQVQDRK